LHILAWIYVIAVASKAAWPVLPAGVASTEERPGGCGGLGIADGVSLPCNPRAGRDREVQLKLENDQGSQMNYSLAKLRQ